MSGVQTATQTYHRREEVVNSLTHLIPAVIFAGFAVPLVTAAAEQGDVRRILSALVFSAALFLLYTASGSYHAARPGRLKDRLKLLDHAAIYVLIAATYTPFTLVSLAGVWGWSLFAVVWTAALAGVIAKVFFVGRYSLLSTLLYIAMGWIVVVAIEPLRGAVSAGTLWALLIGGLLYTGGTLFYHQKRIPYMHAVWHLFVVAGSASHLIAVWSIISGR
jgi:hemolysin III